MEDEFNGAWLVVSLPSGQLIGKLVGGSTGNIISLNPAFDFHSTFQQVIDPETRRPGMVRLSFCSLPGALTTPIPVTVNTTGGSYYQFSDMEESDREEYKKLVRQALEQAKQVRASRSNLVLSREMPRNTGRA